MIPPTDPADRPAEHDPAAEIAALRDRVERLEKQLTLAVKTFAERLTDHGRRLDWLDELPGRQPGHKATRALAMLTSPA